MTVYLDLVMLLNFLVDFLLLLGTNRLSGFSPGISRLLPAAGLGAVYSGACMLPQFRFLGNLVWRIICMLLMTGIAFGWNRSAIKRGSVFLLLSMALGGAAAGIGTPNFTVLVLCGMGVWLLCSAAFENRAGQQEYVSIKLSYGENTASVIALRDTGNSLRDPITGESVVVIAGEVAQKLTGLSHAQIQNPLETVGAGILPGLRLIPYRSVGNPYGMLLALPFEKCVIDGKVRRTLVAFAPDGLGRGEVYQALAGGII